MRASKVDRISRLIDTAIASDRKPESDELETETDAESDAEPESDEPESESDSRPSLS